MHFLNKMERKFGRFAIQGLMKYIILFYVAGYLIEFLAPQAYSFLTLEPYLIFHYGQVWRLVSWVLIPPPTGNFFFAIIMIILYYQLGTALERTWGAFKFNVYIFGGMVFTVLGALLLYVIYGVNTPISMGGSFSTKAESSPRGTITTHMQMTSRIKPNLESPPARNTPHIQQVFIGGPHTYTTLMAVMIPK